MAAPYRPSPQKSGDVELSAAVPSRPTVSVTIPLSQRGAPALPRRSAPDSTMPVSPPRLRRLASPCPERDGFAKPPDQLGVAYTIAHPGGKLG